MPTTIRAFISLELPEAIKQAADRLQERLKTKGSDVSWVKSSGLHLTLKFLGQVRLEMIPEIIKVLEPVAAQEHPFRVSVLGVGAFPHLENPKVVWLGLKGDEGLMQLQRGVEEVINRLGFVPETRPFRPHLTLGRVKSYSRREAFVAALEAEKGWTGGEFELSELCLMKSELQSGGAVHTLLWSKGLS